MNNRNCKCRCGSGLKYKYCCWEKDNTLPPGQHTQLALKLRAKEHKYYSKKYKEITSEKVNKEVSE